MDGGFHEEVLALPLALFRMRAGVLNTVRGEAAQQQDQTYEPRAGWAYRELYAKVTSSGDKSR